ncbi:MAG TPA: BON domain-containing protein, partial [Ktedonobacterales bacterium]|nr:BON domain-containing protein [Ktedonobacterales bacterium]
PAIKPLEVPESKVCGSVRLYATNVGWLAECGDEPASTAMPGANGANGSSAATSAVETPLLLTRETTLGLLQPDGKLARGEVALLGVRVVNADAKGPEYATHFVVVGMPGSGLSRQPTLVPVESLVVGEYVDNGTWAEAQLELRMTPGEYSNQPVFLPDPVILRNANATLDRTVQASPRFTYGENPQRDITAEVGAGRVTLFGTVAMRTVGERALAALLQTPGVVEVNDRILYLEDLQGMVEDALEAKGLNDILVLVEHALVVLNGEVSSSAQRWQAEDIAKAIPGVRGVVNNIVVAEPTTAS